MNGGARLFFPLKVRFPDQHGNTVALEGCDRCVCGVKYWENDRCIDCGSGAPGLN